MCLLVLLGLLMPRAVLLALALFSDWFTTAYETSLWPILGFFFMPFTTLAYMTAMVYNDHVISGGYLVLVIAAVVLDLTAASGSATKKSSPSE